MTVKICGCVCVCVWCDGPCAQVHHMGIGGLHGWMCSYTYYFSKKEVKQTEEEWTVDDACFPETFPG